jgi:hypothetical protein
MRCSTTRETSRCGERRFGKSELMAHVYDSPSERRPRSETATLWMRLRERGVPTIVLRTVARLPTISILEVL